MSSKEFSIRYFLDEQELKTDNTQDFRNFLENEKNFLILVIYRQNSIIKRLQESRRRQFYQKISRLEAFLFRSRIKKKARKNE